MKDDINSGFENLVEVDSKTVATVLPGTVLNKNHACVKSRLNIHLSFWHGINTNQWVTSIIKDGYALPFVEFPPTHYTENLESPLNEKQFVTMQIKELSYILRRS